MDSEYYLQFLLSLQDSITHLIYTDSIKLKCFGNIPRQLWWFKWMVSIDFYQISCNVDANASDRVSILATSSDWTCSILITFVVFFVCLLCSSVWYLFHSFWRSSFIFPWSTHLLVANGVYSTRLWEIPFPFSCIIFFIELSGKK